MKSKIQTRREFIRQGAAAGAAMGIFSSNLSTAGLGQVSGANNRVRIGLIGCGGRNCYHLEWVHRVSKEQNAQIVAVCDIWRQKRERAAQMTKKRFEIDPKEYKDYRQLLDDRQIDAVIIGTPDHQHCTMLIDAVGAGKDVYIEKPIALELKELNAAYDAVKKSKAIVQHGTQGRSSAGAANAREFIQSGRLGEILRVEESRSFYLPYWNHYKGPQNQEDTDWKAFLFNRPFRPFDADQHGAWMGYRDFSSGTIGGWMSHFSDFIHFVTGCGLPVSAVAQGGIYSPTSKKERTCPDMVTAILHYAEGFTTSYTTHFGNGANDYMMFFGTKGVMRTNTPEGADHGMVPRVSGEGSDHPEKIKEEKTLDNSLVEDHMVNWLKCIRSRQQPNADMEAGYKHGVAVVLADRAFVEGRKMMFDAQHREIRPA